MRTIHACGQCTAEDDYACLLPESTGVANRVYQRGSVVRTTFLFGLSMLLAIGPFVVAAATATWDRSASARLTWSGRGAIALDASGWAVPSDGAKPLHGCPAGQDCVIATCYQGCSNLTGGEYPYRDTIQTCCKHRACQHGVSDPNWDKPIVGSTCQEHRGCLPNEEADDGLCYKKCAILTNGSFPHRSGPSTCCKSKHTATCLTLEWMGKAETNEAFRVGGGAAPHMNIPHLPTVALEREVTPRSESTHNRLLHLALLPSLLAVLMSGA